MLSSNQEEVLGFIRDFETSLRDYLMAKGVSQYEMASVYLEMQWKFLKMILQHQPAPRMPH